MKNKGFTLVELMVVTIILGIIFAFSMSIISTCSDRTQSVEIREQQKPEKVQEAPIEKPKGEQKKL